LTPQNPTRHECTNLFRAIITNLRFFLFLCFLFIVLQSVKSLSKRLHGVSKNTEFGKLAITRSHIDRFAKIFHPHEQNEIFLTDIGKKLSLCFRYVAAVPRENVEI